MQASNIMASTLGAWLMAAIYDFIEVSTGKEVRVLVYAAVITMVAGLYFGLRKNKETAKEES